MLKSKKSDSTSSFMVPVEETATQRRRRRIASLVILLLLLGVIIWAVIAIASQRSNDVVDSPGLGDQASSSSQGLDQSIGSSDKSADKSSDKSKNSSGSSDQSSNSGQVATKDDDANLSTDQSVAANQNDMPGTGPAGTLALFIGVSAVSSLIYYRTSRNRS